MACSKKKYKTFFKTFLYVDSISVNTTVLLENHLFQISKRCCFIPNPPAAALNTDQGSAKTPLSTTLSASRSAVI